MTWILRLGLLLMLPVLAKAQTTAQMSLEQAIALGKERSRTLKASSARAEGASARAREASAGLLPSLKFEGSYRRLSDVPPFGVTVPFLPQPIIISPTVLNSYVLRGSVQQPLFTGFKLRSNARAAELLARAGDLDRVSDEEDLVLAITTAYWTLYQAREASRLVDENVARLETYAQDTENLLRAGLATRNDLLKIQVQLSNAKLTQIDAINDRQVAMMQLNNLIGRELEMAIEPADTPRVDNGGPAPPAGFPREAVARAWQYRPDLQAWQARVQAAEAGVRAAQGSWWPQIFLSGNYYYSRPNPRYLPTLDKFRDTWDVGVVLQLDLWNWGATAAQVEQARASMLASRYMFDQMKENTALEVTRSSLAEQRAREKVDVAVLGIGQAEENVRMTRDKYRSGLATSTELLDASVALLQARTNYAGALVEFEISRARLARAAGATAQKY